MVEIEIYWNDLTQEKQKEILEQLGDNGNFDVIPIAIIEFEEPEEKDLSISNTELSEMIEATKTRKKVCYRSRRNHRHHCQKGLGDASRRQKRQKVSALCDWNSIVYCSSSHDCSIRTVWVDGRRRRK